MSELVVVFAKAPVAGKVKTRLCPPLSPEQACAVYRRLARGAWRQARASGAETEACLDAGSAAWLGPRARATRQGGGDLGARMSRAFARAFRGGAERVVLVGTDCPGMSARDLRIALSRLKRRDLVLGPAADGGYWLVGLRAPRPELFAAMPWSTPGVLKLTLARARKSGLTVHLLRTRRDVDTAADLHRCRIPVDGRSRAR